MATLFDQKGKVTPGVGNSLYSNTPEWGGRVWRDANTGAVLNGDPGDTFAQRDIDRYKGLGQAWANTAAPSVDYSGSDSSLGQGQVINWMGNSVGNSQLDALQQTGRMASGMSPSIAGRAAQQQVDSGVAGSYAAGASALGGSLGQAAALRNAASNEAGMRVQGQGQVEAARANEMAQYRQMYAQQAADLRASNASGIGAANANAAGYAANAQARSQLQQNQNAINQQGEIWGEQQAYNVEKAQLDALQQGQDLQAQAYEARRKAKANSNALITSAAGAGIGAVSSMATTASDVRAKQPISLGQAAEMRLWR